MRDRLIELLKKDNCPSPYFCDEKCKYANLKQCYEARTADHLIANGVIVLPCKVGDKLYEITSRKTISEYQVTAIHIELFGIFVDWKITQGFVDRYISDMPAGEIGKTVFLTREEAENALKEHKNNA